MDFFLQQGTDNDYLSVATWDLDEKPYAEAGETPNNWALNDNWRALGQAIIDIHNALALEELADEPSGVGEVLADKSGLWVSSGDNRLHFKDPADVDQIIATIDDINALDPQESVKDFRDFTANEPAAPSVGDRYVNTGTGLSSVTGQSVTANYIYQWNGTNWTEIIPDQGTRLADESTNDMMYYNGASWMNLGAVISHNDTSGLQGGISSEYYHLTASEHTELTNWLDNVILDTNGAMHFGDDVLLNFGSVDNAEIYWESAQTKLRINSSSFIDIRGSSNYVLITGNETTFNNNNSNVDFFIRKNGGGDAFGYDAGTDDFDFYSDIHIADDKRLYFGDSDDAYILWDSIVNSFEHRADEIWFSTTDGAKTTNFGYDSLGFEFSHNNGTAKINYFVMYDDYIAFNQVNHDIDFIVRKNTSGDAFLYDAGSDYFDIFSDIHIPDNTNIYFGDSDDGALYFDGSTTVLEGERISVLNSNTTYDRGIDIYKTGDVHYIDIYTGMSATPSDYNVLTIQSDIVAGTGKIEFNTLNQDIDINIYRDTSGKELFFNAGTNVMQIGNIDGGNYTEIEADGTIKFVGNATVWDDIVIPAMALGTVAATPSKISFLGSGSLKTYGFDGGALTEELHGSFELKHGYKQESDITVHVHWTPTNANAGNVKWQLEYSWQNVDGTFSAPTTINVIDSTDTTAWKHLRANFPAITGTGYNIGSILVFRIFRDPTDASDTYASDAALVDIGCHYQIDTVGSRQITTK
jgi:hypothetical protein